jgi:hypothetical protein
LHPPKLIIVKVTEEILRKFRASIKVPVSPCLIAQRFGFEISNKRSIN